VTTILGVTSIPSTNQNAWFGGIIAVNDVPSRQEIAVVFTALEDIGDPTLSLRIDVFSPNELDKDAPAATWEATVYSTPFLPPP
jgi:hypothetical protein